MASYSQIRLAQLSGSFGSSAGQMTDQLAPLAKAEHSGSQMGASLSDHLSHVVSAIKRIHGDGEFSTAAAGEFSHSITPDSADGAALGSAAKEWSDLFLADGGVINLGSDQDVTLTHVADTGVLLNSTRQIQFGSSAAYIRHDGTDLELVDDADINIKPAVDFLVDAGGDVILDAAGDDVLLRTDGNLMLGFTSGADSVIVKPGASHEDVIFQEDGGNEVFRMDSSAESLLMATNKKIEFSSGDEYIYGDGTDLHIGVGSDGDVNLPANIGLTFGDDGEKIEGDGTNLSIASSGELDLTAGGLIDVNGSANLDVDITGTVAVDATAQLSLDTTNTSDGIKIGTGTSGVPVSIGNAVSEVTVNDNLTVVGDLTVQGATTTLDTTNLLVEDPMILFGSGSTSSNSNGGIALLSGSSTANQSLVFGRVANDVWGFGRKDVENGTVTTLADMTLVTARASKFEIDSDAAHLDVVSGVLTATNDAGIELASGGSGDIVLDSAGDVVIDGTSAKLEFGSAGSGEHITGDGTDLTIASGGDVVIDAADDVIIDAAGDDVVLRTDGNVMLNFTSGADSVIVKPGASHEDIIFQEDGGNEVFRMDSSAESVLMAASKKIEFADSSSHISADSSDMNIEAAKNINVTSTINEANAIYLRANAGTSETIKIHADQGTGVESVLLDSDVGGIKLNAGLDNAAAIHLDSASGLTFAGGDQNDSIYLENSPLLFERITAPDTTTDKLYNVSGELFWSGDRLNGRQQKLSLVITGTHAAGNDITVAGLAHDLGVTGYKTDVFLNGQLMLTGSSSSNGDYALSGATATNLKFFFGLEADDVVQVVRVS